jgi:hypothetical protein
MKEELFPSAPRSEAPCSEAPPAMVFGLNGKIKINYSLEDNVFL